MINDLILKYMDQIELEEKYDSIEYKTTTLYFICPKEILIDKYPDCESTEISIEMLTDSMIPCYPCVMISPTKDGLDYDWSDLDLPYETIEILVGKAIKCLKERKNDS